MKHKRVVILLPSLGGGGAERVAINLANGLAANGVPVAMATFIDSDAYGDLSAKVKRLRYWRRTDASETPIQWFERISRPYDVVIAGRECSADYFVLAMKALQRKQTYAGIVHTVISANSQLDQRPIPWYPDFDCVIAVSGAARDDLVTGFGGRLSDVHVIHNPLQLERIRRLSREPLAEKLGPFFVSVGRMENVKDHLTLLKAYRLFHTTIDDRYHLVILGRGSEQERLKAYASEHGLTRVHFLGFVPNPWKYMRRAAALVSSSICEGFSLVLAEAMICRTPVIATRCSAEVLRDGKAGYLVNAGEPDQIAAAMKAVTQDARSTKAKVAYGARFARSLDLGRIVKRYQAVLDL